MDTASAGPDDAALVARVRDGDADAFGELYDRWFDRVHDVAFRVTHDSAAAADVAQEAFLSAWQQLPRLENPGVFGGWLVRIARNRALDHVRRAARARPSDPDTMAMIERQTTSSAAAPAGFRVEDRLATADDPARAAEDDDVADLVWGAVEALGERDAEVLDLTLRQGMTPAEIAEVVGTNRNAANQMVHRARNHLGDAVRARVLWRRGQPECGDLADALTAAGIDRFGADAVRVTTAHADGCAVCSTRRQLRLDPAHLFAALPLVVAPVLLKQRVAQALMADGVPVQGSAALGATPGAPATADAAPGATHPPDGGDGSDPPDGPGDGGGDGSDGAPGASRSRVRRAALVAAAVLGVLVLAVVMVVAVAEHLDHGTVVELEVASPPRTTAALTTTTTASPPTTAPPASTAGPEGPAPSVATTPQAPETTATPLPPPPPPATVTIAVSPPSRPAFVNYTRNQAPVLSWDSANAAAVTVNGPGVQASTTSGSAQVCPNGFTTFGECTVPSGSHQYTITARDGSGAVVATASATLSFT